MGSPKTNVDFRHIVIGRLMLHGERMSAMFVPPAADNVRAAIKLFSLLNIDDYH